MSKAMSSRSPGTSLGGSAVAHRVQRFAAPLLDVTTPDLEARRPETRARALQIVSCLGGSAYEPAIVAFLDDPSSLVSVVAARALCQPNRAQWIERCWIDWAGTESWSPALTASMLANVGTGAAPAMREYLGDDRRPAFARAAVARSLTLLKDAESADVAAAQLTNDGLGTRCRLPPSSRCGRIGSPCRRGAAAHQRRSILRTRRGHDRPRAGSESQGTPKRSSRRSR